MSVSRVIQNSECRIQNENREMRLRLAPGLRMVSFSDSAHVVRMLFTLNSEF
jgi:hypothetical protein